VVAHVERSEGEEDVGDFCEVTSIAIAVLIAMT
jgi:hypothetical protein